MLWQENWANNSKKKKELLSRHVTPDSGLNNSQLSSRGSGPTSASTIQAWLFSHYLTTRCVELIRGNPNHFEHGRLWEESPWKAVNHLMLMFVHAETKRRLVMEWESLNLSENTNKHGVVSGLFMMEVRLVSDVHFRPVQSCWFRPVKGSWLILPRKKGGIEQHKCPLPWKGN